MSIFQLTGLIGTSNTIAVILDSIRKIRKAKKKIIPLVEEALSCLENIKKRAPLVSVFVEVGGFGMDTLSDITRRIETAEEKLVKLDAKLKNMNKTYKFVSANERVATLEETCQKLERIERDLEQSIPLAQFWVQVSVLLEAIPSTNKSSEIQLLLDKHLALT